MSTSQWVIDPIHTTVEFSVRHMMIASVKGSFREVKGQVTADPENLSNLNAEVTIDAASVDTRAEDRDQHLRSADFFDVENHPEITFRSKRIRPKGENKFELSGDLTIRGITREVDFDLSYQGQGKDPWGNQRIGFSAEAEVNRKDFQLNWNAALEAGGFLVDDKVKLAIQAQAVQQAE